MTEKFHCPEQAISKKTRHWYGNAREVAEVLGVDRSTVHRYADRGLLKPDVVRGNRRYFSKAAVSHFVTCWFTNADADRDKVIG